MHLASDDEASVQAKQLAVDAIVNEILAACERLEHSDALMAHLEGMPALQRLADVDAVSHALARAVQDNEDIRWPMLAALVERFDWAAVAASGAMSDTEWSALQAFVRRRHLRELIAMRRLPDGLQTHYDDLMKHLKPPFGFWRALRIASMLLRDLRQSVAAIRAGFGPESDLIVSQEAEAFVDAVYGADAPASIRFATLLGRAYGFSFALVLLLAFIASVGKGVGWAFNHILPLWLPLFIGCALGVGVVRALRRMFGARPS